MSARDVTSRLRQSVWNGSIPLEIRLNKADCRTYEDSDPYLVTFYSSRLYPLRVLPKSARWKLN